MEGLEQEAVNNYAEYLAEGGDEIENFSKNLKDNDKIAREVAVDIMNMNKGV
jgi:hypothetical protein